MFSCLFVILLHCIYIIQGTIGIMFSISKLMAAGKWHCQAPKEKKKEKPRDQR
jgi:hypothetical protein